MYTSTLFARKMNIKTVWTHFWPEGFAWSHAYARLWVARSLGIACEFERHRVLSRPGILVVFRRTAETNAKVSRSRGTTRYRGRAVQRAYYAYRRVRPNAQRAQYDVSRTRRYYADSRRRHSSRDNTPRRHAFWYIHSSTFRLVNQSAVLYTIQRLRAALRRQ